MSKKNQGPVCIYIYRTDTGCFQAVPEMFPFRAGIASGVATGKTPPLPWPTKETLLRPTWFYSRRRSSLRRSKHVQCTSLHGRRRILQSARESQWLAPAATAKSSPAAHEDPRQNVRDRSQSRTVKAAAPPTAPPALHAAATRFLPSVICRFGTRAFFSCNFFLKKINTIVFSFIFNKYYLIID